MVVPGTGYIRHLPRGAKRDAEYELRGTYARYPIYDTHPCRSVSLRIVGSSSLVHAAPISPHYHNSFPVASRRATTINPFALLLLQQTVSSRHHFRGCDGGLYERCWRSLAAMVSQTRQPHRKTRTGCQPCKGRKIKVSLLSLDHQRSDEDR